MPKRFRVLTTWSSVNTISYRIWVINMSHDLRSYFKINNHKVNFDKNASINFCSYKILKSNLRMGSKEIEK